MSGLQCPKRPWWEVHEPDAPELVPGPSEQFLFDQGHEVGRVARTYVPGGVLIDVPHYERERRLRVTAEAMRAGAGALYVSFAIGWISAPPHRVKFHMIDSVHESR